VINNIAYVINKYVEEQRPQDRILRNTRGHNNNNTNNNNSGCKFYRRVKEDIWWGVSASQAELLISETHKKHHIL
jgi:hypothetical protein